MVQDLKTSNVKQWYSKVKRMSGQSQGKDAASLVQDLIGMSSSAQAELIADKFAEISSEYEPLNSKDIQVLSLVDSRPHSLSDPYEMHSNINCMKKNVSSVNGDIPWRVILEYSVKLSTPLSHIYNSVTLDGVWPDIWELEYVTPVPKLYPTIGKDELR